MALGRTSVAARQRMSSGNDVVNGNVHADVGQEAARAERRALLPGVRAAAQLDVYVAGDQLGLGQLEREGQSSVPGVILHSFLLGVGAGSRGGAPSHRTCAGAVRNPAPISAAQVLCPGPRGNPKDWRKVAARACAWKSLGWTGRQRSPSAGSAARAGPVEPDPKLSRRRPSWGCGGSQGGTRSPALPHGGLSADSANETCGIRPLNSRARQKGLQQLAPSVQPSIRGPGTPPAPRTPPHIRLACGTYGRRPPRCPSSINQPACRS
jgi:hypothetical protein